LMQTDDIVEVRTAPFAVRPVAPLDRARDRAYVGCGAYEGLAS
jgi:hypothetical protein